MSYRLMTTDMELFMRRMAEIMIAMRERIKENGYDGKVIYYDFARHEGSEYLRDEAGDTYKYAVWFREVGSEGDDVEDWAAGFGDHPWVAFDELCRDFCQQLFGSDRVAELWTQWRIGA